VGRPTRRALLAAGLGAWVFPAPALTVRADEASKVSQAEALYRPTPNGLFSCAACTLFVKPRSCKVVAGDISPNGWCKLFDLAD